MPKVKEPNAQYAARSTQTAQILLKEIQGLPEEAIVEVVNYIQYLRNKLSRRKRSKRPSDNISAELRTLSSNETAHLEQEFVNYKKLYPRGK